MKQKLTPAAKRRITADWAALFRHLQVYEPLHLLRRNGPMLSGVCLNRDSGNDSYMPVAHVHNLVIYNPTVSLNLGRELLTERTRAPDSIAVSAHERRYQEAAARLARQSPFLDPGPLQLSDVLDAYRQAIWGEPPQYPAHLMEEVILLLTWCGRTGDALKQLDDFAEEARRWPPGVLERLGGAGPWHEKCYRLVSDPYAVRRTAEENAVLLKVQKIPDAGLDLT